MFDTPTGPCSPENVTSRLHHLEKKVCIYTFDSYFYLLEMKARVGLKVAPQSPTFQVTEIMFENRYEAIN